HGDPLSPGGIEVESDRASPVRPDQRQLGRRAVGQLRDDPEVHPHDADGNGTSLPRPPGLQGVSRSTSGGARGQDARAAEAAADTTRVELHDLPAWSSCKSLNLFFYSRLAAVRRTAMPAAASSCRISRTPPVRNNSGKSTKSAFSLPACSKARR